MAPTAVKSDLINNRPRIARAVVLGSLLLVVADIVYSAMMGINQLNREQLCILYTSFPRWLFLLYEYFVELLIIVLLGVFVSTLFEIYLKKLKRFFPKNQLMAFVYGAVLPVCSCGVIPLIETMKERVPLKVMITFLIAAPLLNPYIVVLAVSIFGVKYTLLRIASAFLLAVLTGFLTEFMAKLSGNVSVGRYEHCNAGCDVAVKDPFVRTLAITKKLLPYILFAGFLGLALELFNPKQYLSGFNFSGNGLSYLIMAVTGIPVYVCNGADILLLKPLISYTDLSMGAAMVFSLSSSAICLSSIVMFARFLGKRLTLIMAVNITVLSVLLGFLIDLLKI